MREVQRGWRSDLHSGSCSNFPQNYVLKYNLLINFWVNIANECVLTDSAFLLCCVIYAVKGYQSNFVDVGHW
jgi:hypothetical protein